MVSAKRVVQLPLPATTGSKRCFSVYPMRPRISLILAFIVAAAAVRPAFSAPSPAALEPGRLFDAEPTVRSCGTPDPTPLEMERVGVAMGRWAEERGARATGVGGTIQVAFHVITGSRQGQVSDGQIAEQIAELNRDYEGTGYRFALASVDRTEHDGWFRMIPGTGNERHAKQGLAIDPAHRLNIYTCRPGARLLGWAYFPWSAPEDHYIHGVVVHFGSMPGGYLSRYDLGRTVVHEVGHYLGLLHTFQGGCTPPGDFVDDTPFEAGPAFECPDGLDTCPDPGLDPTHNYMDYGRDPCLTEFTAGQDARMDGIVPVYRPSLLDASFARVAHGPEIAGDASDPADLTRAIEFRGAGPNPFRSETAVRFTLPRGERVTLRIYNVAGQLVRTLIDAQLPAGAHSAMFAGRDLPAGLYFLTLRVGKAQMTRSAILLR